MQTHLYIYIFINLYICFFFCIFVLTHKTLNINTHIASLCLTLANNINVVFSLV